MRQQIYGGPAYSMGDDAMPAAAAQKAAAERELRSMVSSLRKWLKYRSANDAVASGKRKAKVPPAVMMEQLRVSRDWEGEQKIANHLYVLLSEAYDSQQLPSPDLSQDPNAAVKLAVIAVRGNPSTTVAGPQAQGLAPIIVLPLVIGGVLLLGFTSYIRTQADLQAEKERYQCIQSGGCTDYGFWLKVGGIAALAWFAWEKAGLKEYFEKKRRSI